MGLDFHRPRAQEHGRARRSVDRGISAAWQVRCCTAPRVDCGCRRFWRCRYCQSHSSCASRYPRRTCLRTRSFFALSVSPLRTTRFNPPPSPRVPAASRPSTEAALQCKKLDRGDLGGGECRIAPENAGSLSSGVLAALPPLRRSRTLSRTDASLADFLMTSRGARTHWRRAHDVGFLHPCRFHARRFSFVERSGGASSSCTNWHTCIAATTAHLLARTALEPETGGTRWRWIAWREFLKERERATDDLVLSASARFRYAAVCSRSPAPCTPLPSVAARR